LLCSHNIYIQWLHINTVYQLENSFSFVKFEYKESEEVAVVVYVCTEKKHVKFE